MNQIFTIPLFEHGYVQYVDHLGTDLSIIQAARVSYKSPSKGEEADKKLLEYLFKMRHTSPFEQCNITFNIKMPIFCMRQFVRHRTFRLNEWSGRYSELKDEFYVPEQWRAQDTKNRQGSIPRESIRQAGCTQLLKDTYKQCYECYEALLLEGVAKELARIILPVGVFTEIFVNCDLHNLMHFLYLRTDSHAQLEMQQIAWAMHSIAQPLFPWTMELWSKYKPQMVLELLNQ